MPQSLTVFQIFKNSIQQYQFKCIKHFGPEVGPTIFLVNKIVGTEMSPNCLQMLLPKTMEMQGRQIPMHVLS